MRQLRIRYRKSASNAVIVYRVDALGVQIAKIFHRGRELDAFYAKLRRRSAGQ